MKSEKSKPMGWKEHAHLRQNLTILLQMAPNKSVHKYVRANAVCRRRRTHIAQLNLSSSNVTPVIKSVPGGSRNVLLHRLPSDSPVRDACEPLSLTSASASQKKTVLCTQLGEVLSAHAMLATRCHAGYGLLPNRAWSSSQRDNTSTNAWPPDT